MDKQKSTQGENHSEASSSRKRKQTYKRNHFVTDDQMQNFAAGESVDNTSQQNSRTLIGRWTNEEHDIFVDCLKKYGKDWDKIELKIPTRTGTQIRSHAQKFFARIRKEFKTNDPMEYIKRNMCDSSRVYRFEAFRDSAGSQAPQDNYSVNGNSSRAFKNDEEEEKMPMQTDQDYPPISRQNLNTFNQMQRMNEMNNSNMNNDRNRSKSKVFKVARGKKDSSQESFYNISSEEQKQFEANLPFLNKNFKSYKDGSEGDSNVSTATSYICLNGGKIVIKGNEIETVVPCDIEHINNKVTMISPHQPVRISISPVSLNQSMVYDPKSRSFTSKGSSQSMERKNVSESLSNSNNAYWSMMAILDKSYCLGDMGSVFCKSGSSIPTNLTSQNSKGVNGNGPPQAFDPANGGSFHSSSSNKVSCDQTGKPGGPSSQPVSHNENNQDWFNIANMQVPPYFTPCMEQVPLHYMNSFLNTNNKNSE